MPAADVLPYLPAYLAVCELLSFNKAAQQLGVTTAAVSKAVIRLEEALGVVLLERTTRSVVVTRQGERVRQHFKGAIDEIDAARAFVDVDKTEPRGELVLHTSSILSAIVLQAVSSLMAKHPLLVPRVRFGDRLCRPGEEGVDVAIRLGAVGDDRLVARPITQLTFVTVATPAYLGRRGTPRTVADLVDHDAVLFEPTRGALRHWRYVVDGNVVFGEPRVVATVDHGPAVVDAALLHMGLVKTFEPLVRGLVREGRLVAVLGDVEHERRPVHAVTTTSRARTTAVRSTIAALREAFAPA